MRDKNFQLFQCCIPVKGIKRGVIIDFQRQAFHIVPNNIIDLIEEYKAKKIHDLFLDFKNNKSILKKYIKYFLENELVILSSEIKHFPSLNLEFIKPYDIDTISIEIEVLNPPIIDFFKNQLDELGLNCIKLILRGSVIENLEQILALIENSKVQLISVFTEHSADIEKKINLIKLKNPRLMDIVFFSYQETNIDLKNVNFHYEVLPVEEILFKKISSISSFNINIDMYIESLNFNTIYNRTAFIDSFGNIKNAITNNEIFGNLKENRLKDILEKADFKHFWNISKDKIEVCKDCEFRYICPDGQIPIKSITKQNIYYTNKIKCNYDPYQTKWCI